MSENRQRILEMLDAKKISVEEAMKLLDAVEKSEGTGPLAGGSKISGIKFLRVLIDSPQGHTDEHGHHFPPGKVNIRVPVALIRAGMKFTSLIPSDASGKIEAALREKGVNLNLKNLKDMDVEELIQALSELELDIDSGDKVKVFAE